MFVACTRCGKEFVAQRSTAKFCSAVCRSAASKAKAKDGEDAALASDATVVALASRRTSRPAPRATRVCSVVDAITSELGEAISTSLGQQALVLAERIDGRVDTSGSAVASLSKQLVILTAAALRDIAPDVAVDPVAAVQAQVLAIRQQANVG